MNTKWRQLYGAECKSSLEEKEWGKQKVVGPMRGNIYRVEIIPSRVTDLQLRNAFHTQNQCGI